MAIKPSSPLLQPPTQPPVAPSVTDGSTITRIDYDTYLANRRPGSKTPSIMSSTAAAERKAANTEEIRMTGFSEDKVSLTCTLKPSIILSYRMLSAILFALHQENVLEKSNSIMNSNKQGKN